MGRWWAWVLATGLATGAGLAEAQSPADALVQQLREQGYVEFAVSRTLLGRVRVIALAPDGEQREIVFNPATGEILRDYSEAADGSAAPRVLDRPQGGNGPREAASPTGSAGNGGRSDGGEDGNRGHGNDDDGSEGGNPGRGQGNGGGNGNGNPSRGGGNGNGNGKD